MDGFFFALPPPQKKVVEMVKFFGEKKFFCGREK